VKAGKYGEFATKDSLLDYIADYGFYEGEGLEEAHKAFMQLPQEKRTVTAIEEICAGMADADLDLSDPPDWLPRV
jgi:hypothetical protein